jgi:hypothetical protein
MTESATNRRRATTRLSRTALSGIVALAVVGLAACNATASASVTPAACGRASRLTVQGSGLATGTPDLLTLTTSVSAIDATAQSALAEDNSDTAAVIAALTRGGVKDRDIQTTGLSIQPNYTTKDGNEVLAGFAVNNSVVAMIRNFPSAGSVIDSVSAAGGNAVQIQSLNFSIADPRGLQDEARLDAVHQAVSHASTMAAAAGERLGPVCSLTDDSSVSSGSQFDGAEKSGVAAAPSAVVPLQAGSQQANAQVTLVYALEVNSRARS